MLLLKRNFFGCGALAFTFLAGAASAQTTKALWTFDNGAAGTPFSTTPALDTSGNNYTMFGFNEQFGPSYSADTSSGSGLSSRHVVQDGYTLDAGINSWAPQAWTIELTLRLDNLNNWYTFIGRDGSAVSDIFSDFYLQKEDITDRLRIDFRTASGARAQADSNFVMVANQWYHVAVVSDGTTLSMYVDKNDAAGYQNVASIALPGATTADNALAITGVNGVNWTFGRGWLNNGFVDHIPGNLDDIRFTDGALAPAQFLHATAIPEPSAFAALAGVVGLALAGLRRRRRASV